jgi:hypothetical protein
LVPAVSTKLVVDDSVAAGHDLLGHIVVDNQTAKAIYLVGCGSIFQVTLDGKIGPIPISWDQCAQPFGFPSGQSMWSVQVPTLYWPCMLARAAGCTSSSKSEPLPAGTYQATTYVMAAAMRDRGLAGAVSHIIPAASPVTVRVT